MSEQGEIARELVRARQHDLVITTYPGTYPQDFKTAYAIQDQAIAFDGRQIDGWKLGRVPDDLVDRFAAERLVGPIFSGSIVDGDKSGVAEVSVLRGFAAAEAELLLRIGKPIPCDVELADVPNFIDEVRFGIEIASSPFTGINQHGPAVTASDFGNNYGLVLGPRVPNWRGGGLLAAPVKLAIDGCVVGEGRAETMLDGPFGSVAFLARALHDRGLQPAPGQWISTGAITGVHPVQPGQSVEASFGNDLVVRCKMHCSAPLLNKEGAL